MSEDTTAGMPAAADDGAETLTAPGGVTVDDSAPPPAPPAPRYNGIQAIENTWLRRAAIVAFWIAWPFMVLGLLTLLAVLLGLNVVRAIIREIVDCGEEAGDCIFDVARVSARGTAIAWKRRP